MLERTAKADALPTDADPAERRRALRREQQRRHRARQRRGRRAYTVELDGAVIDLLVRTGWLSDNRTDNDRAVAHAVQTMLADAAE